MQYTLPVFFVDNNCDSYFGCRLLCLISRSHHLLWQTYTVYDLLAAIVSVSTCLYVFDELYRWLVQMCSVFLLHWHRLLCIRESFKSLPLYLEKSRFVSFGQASSFEIVGTYCWKPNMLQRYCGANLLCIDDYVWLWVYICSCIHTPTRKVIVLPSEKPLSKCQLLWVQCWPPCEVHILR